MDLLAILGWLAASLTAVTSLPQVWRIFSSGTSAGVSLLSWQLNLGVALSWSIHGFIVGRPNVIVPNTMLGLCAAMIVWLILKDRKCRQMTPFINAGVILGALTLVDWFAGPVMFAILIMVPSVIALLAQGIDLWQRPTLAGVSLATLATLMICQFVWVIWAVLVGEQAVMIACFMAGVMATFNIAIYLFRQFGWRSKTLEQSSL